MAIKSPFQQFLKDSGLRSRKWILAMGIPYIESNSTTIKKSKTTRNSTIPNKF